MSLDIDHRMARLPLMDNPTKTILVILAYLIFVKVLGPAWMRHRKPYEFRKLLIVYNFSLVVASAWMFHKFGKHGWYSRYSWNCANLDLSEDEDSMEIVYTCWYFYLSKFVELADTKISQVLILFHIATFDDCNSYFVKVFFVLRKKYSQITVLHVVHHAIVPFTAWYCITRSASGYNTLFGFVNTFVHIWMYLYYGLSAFGPWIQKYLWWKKYLTTLQLVQFCIMMVCMILVCITPGCGVRTDLIIANLGQAVVFFVLFINFYRKSYKPGRKTYTSENGTGLNISKHYESGNGVGEKITHND